jgi:hypothetical protein
MGGDIISPALALYYCILVPRSAEGLGIMPVQIHHERIVNAGVSEYVGECSMIAKQDINEQSIISEHSRVPIELAPETVS